MKVENGTFNLIRYNFDNRSYKLAEQYTSKLLTYTTTSVLSVLFSFALLISASPAAMN